MSHNKETKQAWVITVARKGSNQPTEGMPIIVLHRHPDLLKYIMSFDDENVTTQQFLFGGSMKSTADLDSSLMLDKATMDKPELLNKSAHEFTSPLMFDEKIKAEEARDALLENQHIYRKGLLVDYLKGNEPIDLEVVNIYDLYNVLPKLKDSPTEPDPTINL